MSQQVKFQTKKLSTWLLAVTLFFSIHGFSGFIHHSQPSQKVQTEQVFSQNTQLSRRSISYNTAKGLYYNAGTLASRKTDYTAIRLLSSKHVKIKLDALSQQFYFVAKSNLFRQVKSIPQSTDEDLISSFTG